MQKKILVIVLTVLLFLSGALLGFANVFRVDDVVVEVSAISAAAEAEAVDLRAQLKELYEKENILFVNDEKAKEIVAKFPYFRMASFKKDYPNRVVLTVTEDAEVYAVKKADSEDYYILGADGTILAIRQSPLNRLDGDSNVVIEGLTVTGEKGGKASGDERLSTLLAFCNQMSARLNGIRDNILSIQLSPYPPQCWITTREGVKIYVTDVEKYTQQKADKIVDKYLELSDEERLGGCILNVDVGEEIKVAYQKEDLNN
jgi:hypothetical protein